MFTHMSDAGAQPCWMKHHGNVLLFHVVRRHRMGCGFETTSRMTFWILLFLNDSSVSIHIVSKQRPYQWLLLRGGRLIIMGATEQIKLHLIHGCICYHSNYAAPAITTSLSSPIKVPPTPCGPYMY
jgi:hypothetical protein